MKKSRINTYTILGLSLVLSSAVIAFVGCGGSNTTSSTSPTTGTVQTFLSDPPTCSEAYSAVWVTITKVQANLNANAGPNSSGWQTLVDLSNAPKQVNLLSLNPNSTPGFCGTLYMLGNKALPPGKYQQIRLILLANNATATLADGEKNACSTGFNCVVPNGSSNSYELQLPSEAQTGIKIPSSQIANGGLTVTAGESADFNIDIDTCASILQEGPIGSGNYLLKPVLHSGEVTLNGTNTISGKVVEGANSPSPGTGIENALVLLEQPNSDTPPTDQVVWAEHTNSDGTFAFCPVASDGTNYDVVVAGQTTQTTANITTTTTYNPSVVFNVPVGGATGSVPLFPETTTGGAVTGTAPATISGQITTQGSGSSAIGGNVQLSALQSVTNGSNPVNLTVPVLDAGSTPSDNVTDSQPPVYTTITSTSTSGTCATSSEGCVAYSVEVPASPVAVGTYSSSSGNDVTAPSSTNSAQYTINGLANGTNGLLNCTNPANGSATSNAVTVSPGSSVDQSSESTLTLNFSGCSVPTTP